MDYLGKVVIYNTKEGDLVMEGKYDVTVKFNNGTSVKAEKQAEFNPLFNVTMYDGWNPEMGSEGKHFIPLFNTT